MHHPSQEQPAVQKQITITPFQFTPNGVPGDVLQSYNYVNGSWVLEPWNPAVDGRTRYR